MLKYFLISICILLFIAICYMLFRISKEDFVSYHDPKIDELKNKLVETFPELDEISLSASNKSFTINKKKIYLCLKDEKGEYYNTNFLTYVLLHELSHVMNKNHTDHGKEFQRIFTILLERAVEEGLYDDTQPLVDNYCEY